MSDHIHRNEQFGVHKLSDRGFVKANQIRDAFDRLLNDLSEITGDAKGGREFSLVKTKLEEACFFAKKSMAINGVNQIIEEQKDS